MGVRCVWCTTYWSFSSAGWFCRLGRRALSLPVSVFRFMLQWILDLSSTSSCSGWMKVPSMVSIELI